MNINISFNLDSETYIKFINYGFDTSDAIGFVFKTYKQKFNLGDGSLLPTAMYEDKNGISQDTDNAKRNAELFDKHYTKFKKAVDSDILRIKNLPEWPAIGGHVIIKGRPKDDFEIIICKCSENVRKQVLSARSFSRWSYPYYPEDICFFRNHCCWFLSDNYEKRAILTITNANDIANLYKIGVIDNSDDERYCERY